METRVIKEPITKDELQKIAQECYGDFVKVVVDAAQGIMAVGGEFHADEEVVLMEQEGSPREHTWGINIWPSKEGTEEFIQFDSMINLKPSFGNRTRGVDNEEIQNKIRGIVARLII